MDTGPSHLSLERILRYLARSFNLRDPESARLFISKKQVARAKKERIANAYPKSGQGGLSQKTYQHSPSEEGDLKAL